MSSPLNTLGVHSKTIRGRSLRTYTRLSALLRAILSGRPRSLSKNGARGRSHLWVHAVGAAFILTSIAFSEQPLQRPDLTEKSLEDLMNVEVTSVSKKEQKTSEVAAAVFVISADDIRRSGALNVPDLLRMVPGVEVAQLNGSVWAISVRGFNGQESNKLLVLIDGRTVYSPIFAGVFWDAENVPLESIDRIEIIRGPGAAVWGSNAVNGVINIITKAAANTKGGYVSAGGGSLGTTPEIIRYGAKAGQRGAYRLYAKGFHTVAQYAPDGTSGRDDWSLADGGLRTDFDVSSKDTVTAEGEIYKGEGGELAVVPVSIEPPVTSAVALRDRYSGWNLLSRWSRTFSPESQASLQVYFDRTSRGDTTYSFDLNTIDADFQDRFAWRARQDFVWGFGFRSTFNSSEPTSRISFQPANRNLQLFSSFVQDEIKIVPGRLNTTLGMRLENTTYTGLNFEPSIHLVWMPNDKSMIWSAISKADRTPARSDRDIRVNVEAIPTAGPLPLMASYFGNPKQRNENVIAFEAGYRNTVSKQFSFDSSIFYNRYHDLVSVEPGAIVVETNPPPAHLLMPWTFGNGLTGETHGFEMFANWKVISGWTLSPGYSFLTMHIHRFASSQDVVDGPETEGSVPNHQAELRSHLELRRDLQWNVTGFFVGRLPAVSIPSYTRLDTNITWHPGERWSLSVVGQNLLRDKHAEFAGPDSSVQSGLIRREAYAKVAWSF